MTIHRALAFIIFLVRFITRNERDELSMSYEHRKKYTFVRIPTNNYTISEQYIPNILKLSNFAPIFLTNYFYIQIQLHNSI